MIDAEHTASWDDPPEHDDDEAARLAAEHAAGGDDADQPKRRGSIVAEIGEAAEAIVEDNDDTKVLQVGIHPILRARYRPLTDEARDELQAKAKARFRRQSKIGQGHRKKGEAGNENEVERYYDALLIAASCVEILVEDEDGELTPLQEHLETDAPVRYTRELAKVARLDETFGLDLTSCTSAEIVKALHSWGKARSTTPLSSRAQVLKLWMGQVDAEALEEVLGNR